MSDYLPEGIVFTRHTLARAEGVSAFVQAVEAAFAMLPPPEELRPAFGVDTGVANAYVIPLSPAAESYALGMEVRFATANTNTGPSTIRLNNLDPVPLRRRNGLPVEAGDVLANAIVQAHFDGEGFRLAGVPGGASDLAQQWASKTDGPVAGGEFSAKHWALAAEAAAAVSQGFDEPGPGLEFVGGALQVKREGESIRRTSAGISLQIPYNGRSGSYTVTAADRGGVINVVSGTWQLTLPTIASLISGFFFYFRNFGEGTTTLQPSGGETIDGFSFLSLGSESSGIVIASPAGWIMIRSPLRASQPLAEEGINNTRMMTPLRVAQYVTARLAAFQAEAQASLHVRQTANNGVDGGTFSSGSWVTRPLNTVVGVPTIVGASLAASQITLPAGTYEIEAWATAVAVNRHQLRLRNVTDGADLLVGASASTGGSNLNDSSLAMIDGRFVLAAPKLLELQHRCASTRADTGMGAAASFGVQEIYASARIIKTA